MASGIVVDHLSVRYSAGAVNALSDISLAIPPGSCCAILGPTGAGKTTLLHSFSGVLGKHHPEAVALGSMTIGSSTFDPLPKTILFPHVALALQDPYVQISGVRETVYDEVFFTLENLGYSARDGRERIPGLLQQLGIDHLSDRQPTALSGGETQRVALATILIARPEVLLLDEPTTALDATAKDRLSRILRLLKGNTSVIIADTQVDFALGVADRVVVLHQGRISFNGTPADFFSAIHRFENVLPAAGWKRARDSARLILQQPSHPSKRLVTRLGIL